MHPRWPATPGGHPLAVTYTNANDHIHANDYDQADCNTCAHQDIYANPEAHSDKYAKADTYRYNNSHTYCYTNTYSHAHCHGYTDFDAFIHADSNIYPYAHTNSDGYAATLQQIFSMRYTLFPGCDLAPGSYSRDTDHGQ